MYYILITSIVMHMWCVCREAQGYRYYIMYVCEILMIDIGRYIFLLHIRMTVIL